MISIIKEDSINSLSDCKIGLEVVFRPVSPFGGNALITDSDCVVSIGSRGKIVDVKEFTAYVKFDNREIVDIVTPEFLSILKLTAIGKMVSDLQHKRCLC